MENEEEESTINRKDEKTIRSNIERMYKKCRKELDKVTENLIT